MREGGDVTKIDGKGRRLYWLDVAYPLTMTAK